MVATTRQNRTISAELQNPLTSENPRPPPRKLGSTAESERSGALNSCTQPQDSQKMAKSRGFLFGSQSASHIFAPLAYFTLFSSCGGHLHSNRTSFILPYFHEKEILEYKTNAFWYVCIIIKLLRFNKWIIP